MNAQTWILVADSARARIIATDPLLETWSEPHVFVHPEARLSEGELVSDLPHGGGRAPRSHPLPATSRHDIEGERFASDVARFLDHARCEAEYEDLVLVAPPRFLGLLRGQLDPQVTATVQTEVPRDYSRMKDPELRSTLTRVLGQRPLMA